ncbi:MAG: bifunctional serine/threonine-protein kinase/formylglycine-generating enzyme family protein [Planctomycetota bacterium]|nr:bifunctional serine/threonine-protein kinase/formylglycine-generating enzyme family protein [Planctomycetota bacterium]
MAGEADLLFGVIALQMNLITKEQLVECAALWMTQETTTRLADGKTPLAASASKTIPELLLEKGYIERAEKKAVESLVKVHLKRHGSDPARGIAAVGMRRELKEELLSTINTVVRTGKSPTRMETVRISTDQLAGLERLGESIISAGEIRPPDAVVLTRPPETKYTIKEEIGKGGLGRVMLATDNDFGRPVALKFVRANLPSAYIERFHRESVITGRLEHPNIVPVHDIGVMEDDSPLPPGEGQGEGLQSVACESPSPPPSPKGGRKTARSRSQRELYMAMKLVKGRDLGRVIDSIAAGDPDDVKTWTVHRLVETFHDVCMAMAFAHSRGVIHRDLKPSNIMVGEFGETLVVDWGLAKGRGDADLPGESLARGGPLMEQAEPACAADTGEPPGSSASRPERPGNGHSSSQLTIDGSIMGTPQYMPPEQARGHVHEIDERSDIYSLGAVLYEILTLQPPFEGQTAVEVLRKVIAGQLTPPSTRAVSGATGARRAVHFAADQEAIATIPLGDADAVGGRAGSLAEGAGPAPEGSEGTACGMRLIGLVTARPIPPELEQICLKCLSERREDRYQSVEELAGEIRLYLEGSKERERHHELAEKCARDGREFLNVYYDLKGKVAAAKRTAGEAEEKLKGYEPIDEQRPVWQLRDAAEATERAFVRALNDAVGKFMEGIGFEADNENVRKGLSELYWDRFLSAEEHDNEMDAAYYRSLVLAYGREWYEAKLKGDGTLSVRTQVFTCDCLTPKPHFEVVIHPHDMVMWPLGSRQFREDDRCHVPRVTTGRGTQRAERRCEPSRDREGAVGHNEECAPVPLSGARVWLFKFKEKDRILVPAFPDGVVSAATADQVRDAKEVIGASTRLQGVSTPPTAAVAPRAATGDPMSPAMGRAEEGQPLSLSDGLFIGVTPIEKLKLPMGSYLLLIRGSPELDARYPLVATRYLDVRCPIFVGRGQDIEQLVTMYGTREVPDGFVIVPGGKFIAGGQLAGAEERQVRDVPDFFIARHPVTCAEYLEFLNDLAKSDLEQAKKRAPREGEESGFYWLPDENGVFRLPPPGKNRLRGQQAPQDWQPDWPVFSVSWYDALAFCEWRSRREGRLYRLLTEEEREKASRGVDGRVYPFGKHCSPRFCNIVGSFKESTHPARIGVFPLDESPYGVKGVGGNSRDWCWNDPGEKYRAVRCLRGGAWSKSWDFSRAAKRWANEPTYVNWYVTFRLGVSPRSAVE